MKESARATILCLLLTASFLGMLGNLKPVLAMPGTVQVFPGDSIQDAINHASPGDTIVVAAGTYKENIVLNQSVALMGSGRDVTIVEAKVDYNAAIEVKINNANISGFTIQSGYPGISIIEYNASRIYDSKIVLSKGEGILLSSSQDNIIHSNVFSSNTFEGVYLTSSNHNLIYDNVMIGNHYSGVGLSEANNNRVSNNTIALSGIDGLYLESSNESILDGNTLSNNNNGVTLIESYNNVFYHNNFINNKYQVDTLTEVNSWNSTDMGNYWSDYTHRYPNAQEVDSTGIWDTPYVIDATNQDDFPLMNPWNPPADVTPPFTTDDYDNLWHNEDFSINLTAVDDLSGVKETYYIINDGQLNNLSASGQPYIATESSNNTLEYWSTDKAGNNETHHFLTGIKLDKTPPSDSIQISDGALYSTSPSVTLSLSATDSLSGIELMRFSNDNMTWTPWESYSTSKAWNLTAGDGAKTVYVMYMDNAGLSSQVYNDAIVLDTAPPTVSILSPAMGAQIESQNVTISWNGTDLGSGIDHFELILDEGSSVNVGTAQTYTFTGLSNGNHIAIVKAFDKIGHTNVATVNFTVGTSPFGLSFLEMVALVVVVIVVIAAIAVYALRVRKKRHLGSD